jgi:hypothetical protein
MKSINSSDEGSKLYHGDGDVVELDVVALDLYPSLPKDLDDWATDVMGDTPARDKFLNSIQEQYCVTLYVNRVTGEFYVGNATFFAKS